ncbi:ArsR/SmtB family transcription factor [Massilia sp. TSP1-1-2]|uniref:ArsR/SmtB family transcription factor n=1 Tax=unclassified Massilia TaxID=2609279 RepID=UPI003CEBC2CC
MNDLAQLDPAAMQAAATRACTLFKVLANRDRLLLLCQLTQGPLCVGELESISGIQQPTLSQQLAVLRDEALVTTRREGKQIFYSMASAEALAVMQVLSQLYCATAEGATT